MNNRLCDVWNTVNQKIITPKKSYMLQLENRNPIVFFICSARIKNGAVSKTSDYQYTETYRTHRTNYHTEKNDRRQNTNIIPRRKNGRREKNQQLSTMVRTIQTMYEKKLRYRYRTTNQRRNDERNRMGCNRRKDTTRLSSSIAT